MARVRRGPKARERRNRILKQAKGFHLSRRKKYRRAAETVERALHYSYISRRLLKRDMRRLWIQRIGAAARNLGTSYSRFMEALGKKGISINRKMLADLAFRDAEGFKALHGEAMNPIEGGKDI